MVEKTKEPSQPVVGTPRVNKMNMRRKNLNNLLKCHERSNMTPSANTLRNLMQKNDSHMDRDATSSLDLMRKIFQPDLTREITQLLERYTTGTFLPAVHNLRKNGQIVSDQVMKELYANILDEAKKEILKSPPVKIEPEEIEHQPMQGSVMRQLVQVDDGYNHYYAQPTQPLQQIHQPMNQQRIDYQMPSDVKPPRTGPEDLARWTPDRFNCRTLFTTAQHVAAILQMSEHQLLNSQYTMMFRYACDAIDINKLIEDGRIARGTNSCYLLAMEDVVATFGTVHDPNYSFPVNEQIIGKLRQSTKAQYVRMYNQVYPAVRVNQPQMAHPQVPNIWGNHH